MTTTGVAESLLVAFDKAKKNVIDFIYDYIKDHGGCVILCNVLPYRDGFVRADGVACDPNGGVILRTPGGDLNLDWYDINTYVSILSILNDNVRSKLAEGVTVFQYLKKDGTIREARGTTNHEIITAEGYAFKGSQRPAPEGVTVYWDLDAHGWRSFVTANLL